MNNINYRFVLLFFFSDIIRGVIDDVVAGFVVLPNRITVPLTNVDPYELKYPLPDVSSVVSSVLCQTYKFCSVWMFSNTL